MDENALAKSKPREDIQTHTDELLNNLEILKKLYPNLYVDWDLLRYACIYHDLGKLNPKFQERIKTGKRYSDEIPHGILSLAFIDHKKLRESFGKKNLKVLFQAVAYHHDRKMPFQNEDIENEFKSLRKPFERFIYDKLPGKYFTEILDQRYFSVNKRFYEEHEEFFNFIMLEGLLNRLDYAASAHIPVENPNDFLNEAMDNLMSRWQKNNHTTKWNDMQNYLRNNAERNVIVIAQTGMGKTEAALLWLANNKGFFTLPLKSAINAIYQRIINEVLVDRVKERVGMLHSDTYVKYLELNQSKQIEEDEALDIDVYYTKTKQLSLPLTICTLDQIFGFVFRYRGFEQQLATLSYSKVIIDEVQMYASDLIAYLILGLHYITRLGGRFAILTATLPTFFIDLLKLHEIPFELPRTFTDDKIRHSLKVLDKEINVEDIISYTEQYAGKKILVICNTIKTAVNLYRQLIQRRIEGQSVNLFHSCFTKADRALKEQKILEMGKSESDKSGIWISTQIVEASLDIDFDLLFTELSDLNGLFQRMGRCYRKRKLDTQLLPYNCFVFTGGDKRCSGVGVFIDKVVHRLSKEALLQIDGVVSEGEKVAMVEKLYTKENLPLYYNDIVENIRYVQSYQSYELNRKEAAKKFRNIDMVSVMPFGVYLEHKATIDAVINELQADYSEVDKVRAKMRKAKARGVLSDLTVDIFSYLARSFETEILKINEYEQIALIKCEYNSQEGIIKPEVKATAEVRDFSDHSF